MAEYIRCKNCDPIYCNGCNIKILETMLDEGKFDCLMNGNRSINQSADVAPVRHGKWVLDKYVRYFRCSVCGTQFDDETDTFCNIMNGFAPNYCEDCGAKMDGGADNGC